MPEYTAEQQAAINAQGKTIVSASAGSGKTTVMIEKIVRLIQNGTDVEEILAVTYTKKAAAQMKEKLRKELIKAINEPARSLEEKTRLKKQLPKVSSADISTVHSFCSRLIRSNFFAAGVSADFFIIGEDNAEGTELQNKAIDSLFEEAYAGAEEGFLKLLSVYFRSKKDAALRKLIKDAYFSLRTRADYKEILKPENMRATEEKFDGICAELFRLFQEKCEYYAKKIQTERDYFSANGYAPSEKNANELLSALSAILSCGDLFEARKIICPSFSAKQKKGKDFPDEFDIRRETLALYKDKVKGIYAELSGIEERENELSAYLSAGEIGELLAQYILKFDEKYEAEKRERNALDYNDLEHICLKLLKKESVLKQIREKYTYVFVDEYQDVNPVQEELLSLLSGDNVFLVGDIKQAIYGFRGSKSEYFAQKQRSYELLNGANALLLKKNFRSSGGILKAVNEEFSSVMKTDVCEVDYAATSLMDGGDRYGANEGRVQIHFLQKQKKTKEKIRRGVYSVEQSYLNARAERSAYGEKIKQIVLKERNLEWFDADEGKKKRVEYSDIAILCRKKKGGMDEIIAALSDAGIPVAASAETNVCDYPEIKALVDILSLIDNAEQDIPLCSALLSAMGDLTATELAKIRIAYPTFETYRECCRKYAEEKADEIARKLNEFFDAYEKIRTLSAVLDAGEILTKILSETKMEARLLSRDNGAGCLKRIHYFVSQTAQSEQLSVHEFLDLLRSLDYYLPYSESGGENAVKIMTMHASKGLEYPVVILDDLSRTFKGEEEKFLHFDERFGFAPKCYDGRTMTQSNTLLWRLCKEKNAAEEIKNELNLFYVATTRAKFALHMLYSESALSPDVKYARSYADFTDFARWGKYVEEERELFLEKEERNALVTKADEKTAEEIKSELNRKYPFEGVCNLPVKTSASARMKTEEKQAEYYAVPERFDETDGEETGKTDILSGLAYHAFLEQFDFYGYFCLHKDEREEFVRSALEQMKQSGVLTAEYAAVLDEKKLLNIVSLPVFLEAAKGRLLKEQEFLCELPVSEVYENSVCSAEEDGVLVQGAIDLLSVSEDRAWIVDYKYSSGGEKYLKEKYALQLQLYKTVVARVLKIPKENVRCTIVNIFRGFSVEL